MPGHEEKSVYNAAKLYRSNIVPVFRPKPQPLAKLAFTVKMVSNPGRNAQAERCKVHIQLLAACYSTNLDEPRLAKGTQVARQFVLALIGLESTHKITTTVTVSVVIALRVIIVHVPGAEVGTSRRYRNTFPAC